MQDSDSPESDLVERARAGDVAAFEALYRLHCGKVYGLCVRLAATQAEAEDCTQETFITAWQRLPDFRGESRLATWLHAIAYNEVVGRKRRYARDARHLAAMNAAGDDGQRSDAPEVEDLERAISRLPSRAREAFVLQKIYGYTHDETAGIMGITAGACKAQVHRALRLLAAALPSDDAPMSEAGSHRESR
jgi:RNA polymerase sigma-70 factor (ECF subfamily)